MPGPGPLRVKPIFPAIRVRANVCETELSAHMKIITDSRCTAYSSPAHPEKPARVSRTVERLKNQTELPIDWAEPLPVEEAVIERAHSKAHVARITAATADFDGDTPAHPD